MNPLLDNSTQAHAPLRAGVSVNLRRLLIGLAAGIIALLVWRLMHIGATAAAQMPSVPSVSVTSIGANAAPTIVSMTGTISARYDIPVGVEGEGGRVAAIYVEAGDRVKRGQLLAKLNVAVLTPQVASLEAALEQSRAEADLANAEYHRAEGVGAAGALSAEETQRRKSAAVTAAAKVKVAAAQLAEAVARLGRAEVRAPADGIILTRNIELGQTAAAGGAPLFRLSEGGETELRAQVAEQDLPRLQVGQPAAVRLTGIDRVFEGEIRLLGAVIDPQTRMGSVRVALKPDPDLRPGAFARADVTISRAAHATLPQTAVLSDDRGTYVLVVNGQGRIERRAVRVGGTVSGGVLIAEGIGASDRIVKIAGGFLQEGESVRIAADAGGTP